MSFSRILHYLTERSVVLTRVAVQEFVQTDVGRNGLLIFGPVVDIVFASNVVECRLDGRARSVERIRSATVSQDGKIISLQFTQLFVVSALQGFVVSDLSFE